MILKINRRVISKLGLEGHTDIHQTKSRGKILHAKETTCTNPQRQIDEQQIQGTANNFVCLEDKVERLLEANFI